MSDLLIPNIRFIDIDELEVRAKQQLGIDIEKLEARKSKNIGLSTPDDIELERLKELRDAEPDPKFLDPLFVTARAAFAANNELRTLKFDHDRGVLVFPGSTDTQARAKMNGPAKDANVARVGLVLGLLQLYKAPLPQLIAHGDTIGPDPTHKNAPLFDEVFYKAIGRAAGNMELAKRVLKVIAESVDVVGDRQPPKVSTLEFAKVVEKLIEQSVQPSDPNLKRRVDGGLDRVQDTGRDEKPPHEIGIKLPDLEADTDYQIIEDNIRLMGPMIFASMFDELKAFQVVDKLIEMSQRGQLSLIRGKAGTQLYNYWRQAPNRMSEVERQTFYAMTLGIPTGPPGVQVNRDFQDLWIRFVSSVSALVRENRVDQMLRSSLPIAINQQQVKKAARDLASNMSLYGYGMAYYAAVDLQNQINEMIELLKDAELRASFGARDMWGVIDPVVR